MWFLDIKCLALLAACLSGDAQPMVQRFYPTRIECNNAAIAVATKWYPGYGAWSFTCVEIKGIPA